MQFFVAASSGFFLRLIAAQAHYGITYQPFAPRSGGGHVPAIGFLRFSLFPSLYNFYQNTVKM